VLQNRAKLVINGVTASKAAGVPHTLVLSVASADITSSLFGRQFAELETFVKRSGITFTLLRLPMFTDNLWYVPVLPRCGMALEPARGLPVLPAVLTEYYCSDAVTRHRRDLRRGGLGCACRAQAETIKSIGKLFGPASPTARFSTVRF
jgi:uncharacterized protein YbjT (DUF2867 family)